MKKLFIIIVAVLGLSLSGLARTLKIVYLNDSTIKVSLRYNNGSETMSLKDIIHMQIDSISMYENDLLPKAEYHQLKIGGEVLATSKGQSLRFQKDDSAKLINPITIKENDVLSAYRGESLVSKVKFAKKLSVDDFKDAITVRPQKQDSNGSVIIEREKPTLAFYIDNPKNIKIDSIYMYDASNNKISAIAYADSVSVSKEVTFTNPNLPEDQDTISAILVFTSPGCVDHEIKFDNRLIIVRKKNSSGISTLTGVNWKTLWIILIIALVLVIVFLVIFFIHKKRKMQGEAPQPASTPPYSKDGGDEGSGKVSDDHDDKNPPEDPKGGKEPHGISLVKDNNNATEQRIRILESELNDIKKQLEKNRQELSEAVATIADKNRRIEEDENKINSLKVEITNQSNTISSLQKYRNKNEELIKENKRLINEKRNFDDLKAKNQRIIEEIKRRNEEIKDKEKQIQSLNNRLVSVNNSKAAKEEQINSLTADKNRLDQNLREEKNKTSDLKHRLDSFSKQTHYLYLIDEALSNIERRLPMAFGNVTDETMRRKLVDPIVIGTPGLDEAGIESYKAEWLNEVFNNQPQFFGKDVQLLSDDEVVETLREKFIENLAMRDSFNKLVRLYLFSNVGWLNVKLVEAGFDVDTIQTMFSELKNLFDRFGVEISYPRLFIDKFDESKHRDSHRCIIFTLFEPTPEVVALASAKDGESLIVDLVRIGLPRSKTSTRRIPMVSLPNF